MLHTCTCRHDLHISCLDRTAIAHTILMRQRPLQWYANNFHIIVSMPIKTLTTFHLIIVQYPQGTKIIPSGSRYCLKLNECALFSQPKSTWPRSPSRCIIFCMLSSLLHKLLTIKDKTHTNRNINPKSDNLSKERTTVALIYPERTNEQVHEREFYSGL